MHHSPFIFISEAILQYKERNLHQVILSHIKKPEYTIIIGARQVGKTTLVKKIHSELKKELKHTFFLSLEDKNILTNVNRDPENIFQYARRPPNPLISSSNERTILFIDEIQYAEDPSHLLKYLYDTYQDKLKIIATGSSAFYIDNQFKDSLSGRKRLFHLKSLNFSEFLQFKNAATLIDELKMIRDEKDYISTFYAELLHQFDEYLTFGGYPRVVLELEIDEKKVHLQELVYSFVKKDIYESRVENEDKFFNLMTILASQTGQLLNKNELANTLNLNIRTIERYLTILEKCHYTQKLRPFYRNIRKEITQMPKLYFSDLGIRNKLINRFDPICDREDKGQLLENYIYLRLLEKYDDDQIKFWRTAEKREIDFIVSESFNKGFALEVKYNDQAFKKSKYKTFQDYYTEYKLQCISYIARKEGIPILKL